MVPPPPTNRHETWGFTPLSALLLTSGGRYWRPVQTCSLEDLPPLPHWYRHLVVATETDTVGKRAVRILLECCLVQ